MQNEGLYSGQNANPATNLLIKSNPTAGGRPQTQLGTTYWWPLVDKELLRPLAGFVFNPAVCPYHTPSSQRNLVDLTVSSPTTRPWNRLVQVDMVPEASHRFNLTWPDIHEKAINLWQEFILGWGGDSVSWTFQYIDLSIECIYSLKWGSALK